MTAAARMWLGVALAAAGAPATAQPREATAAMVYTYDITDHAGFEAGYRDHLGWHRDASDSLPWYGWFVVAGDNPGRFVDATVAPFEAIDHRPNLKGDAAHFAAHVAAFTHASRAEAWRLWPQASTSFTLERRAPTPFLDVYIVQPTTGHLAEFETLVGNIARTPRRREAENPASMGAGWTWYRAVLGSGLPRYVVLVPRSRWSELAARHADLGGIAADAVQVGQRSVRALNRLGQIVSSETWSYRADLSLNITGTQ